jgi:hypothetical protein
MAFQTTTRSPNCPSFRDCLQSDLVLGYYAIDGRTSRHEGYKISQQKRNRVEEIFGWMKTVGGMRKLRHRGLELVGWMFTFAAAAYNLLRIRNLSTSVAGANA